MKPSEIQDLVRRLGSLETEARAVREDLQRLAGEPANDDDELVQLVAERAAKMRKARER